MAEKRIVSLALIGYYGENAEKKPIAQYGSLGEEVSVHDSDLARFDELNDQHKELVTEHVFVQEPDHFEHQREVTPEPEVELIKEPAKKAPLADWQAYAEQEEVPLENEDGSAKTKRELVDELTGD